MPETVEQAERVLMLLEAGERYDDDEPHAAVVELIAYLLDEDVALGDMHRLVESVRVTLGERERGIEEFMPPAAAATTSAARELVKLLLTPHAERSWKGSSR